jgi:hypothetical protein
MRIDATLFLYGAAKQDTSPSPWINIGCERSDPAAFSFLGLALGVCIGRPAIAIDRGTFRHYCLIFFFECSAGFRS